MSSSSFRVPTGRRAGRHTQSRILLLVSPARSEEITVRRTCRTNRGASFVSELAGEKTDNHDHKSNMARRGIQCDHCFLRVDTVNNQLGAPTCKRQLVHRSCDTLEVIILGDSQHAAGKDCTVTKHAVERQRASGQWAIWRHAAKTETTLQQQCLMTVWKKASAPSLRTKTPPESLENLPRQASIPAVLRQPSEVRVRSSHGSDKTR